MLPPAAMPAETMAAVVASHVRRGGIAERRTLLLVAAGLLIVLAAGAVAVGSGLIRRGPEPQPAPQPVVVPSLDATAPTPSDSAAAPEHVFYTVFEHTRVGDEGCTEANAGRSGSCFSSRIWVAGADGGNARELFPESTDQRSILDVSRLGNAMVFTAPTQINGQPISASHLADLGPAGDVLATRVISNEVLDDGCVGVCAYDSAFAFSPDGTRLAYVRTSHQGEDPETTVIAIQDVSTGEVIELESTRASGPDGYNGAPVWSPDGRQLLFTRDSIGVATPDHRLLDTATFVVDVDGSNLRQLVDTELSARDAAWSPDGSKIAFTSAIAWLGVDQFGKRENFNEDSDVYTVRADGSDRSAADEFRTHARGPWRPVCRSAAVSQAGPATGGSCSPCTGGPARAIRRICRPRSGSWTPTVRTRGRSMARTCGSLNAVGLRRLPVPAGTATDLEIHGLLETRAVSAAPASGGGVEPPRTARTVGR